eukprot:CAMPEP_0119110384 /NCGR_PEP_ID=MMETSP1180-20130426/29328_1 /TAXON_ID=3052 ORGANISM="Chlamydomonas cf sp, Strain CCMP681" /NCGR_SAMPLE_ID=MMETSP1180 /ASSEMBLY_ACC=CAM_ASM_000741 /LENGTH=386 /DNA_ID=CAMNT_0007096701 /DNA_START=112 /DNA_END=1272 /DNA_ORIENTATION=+
MGTRLQHVPSPHTGRKHVVAAAKRNAPTPAVSKSDEAEPMLMSQAASADANPSASKTKKEDPQVAMNELAAHLLRDFHGLGETEEEVLASLHERGVEYVGIYRSSRRYQIPATEEDREMFRQAGVQAYAETVKSRICQGRYEVARALRLTARKTACPAAKKMVAAMGDKQEVNLRWAAAELSRRGFVWEAGSLLNKTGPTVSTPDEFYTKLVQMGVTFVDVNRNHRRFKVPDNIKLGLILTIPELAFALRIKLMNKPVARAVIRAPSRLPPSFQQVEDMNPDDAVQGMKFLATKLLERYKMPGGDAFPETTEGMLKWLESQRVVCVSAKAGGSPRQVGNVYRSYAILQEGVTMPLTTAALCAMPVLPLVFSGTTRTASGLGLKLKS